MMIPAFMQRLFTAARAHSPAWQRLRHKERKLRVAETVGLGERRFVAVLEYEDQRFLVGGTANSLALLARLKGTAPAETSFEDVLQSAVHSRLH